MKNFLSYGGGVQSSTLLLMSAFGEVPPFDAAIFADTQREPASVYAWMAFIREQLAKAPNRIPLHTVTVGDLGQEQLHLRTSKRSGEKYARLLVPAFVDKGNGKKALMARKCTAEYKVRALIREQRRLAAVPRGAKILHCRTAIGISTDEAIRVKPSTEPWCENYWPLLDLGMSRTDCLAWYDARNLPRPPKSACYFCPFHSDEEWARLQREEPAEFARAVAFDEKLRAVVGGATGVARLAGPVYLHSTLRPLGEISFGDTPSYRSGFGNDCTGLCGV